MGDERRSRTLVLGIGNLLMGDEGVGVHVARELGKRDLGPDVDVVDGGTGGFQLLDYFASYERLILVDASADGESPGTVRVLHPRFSRDFPPTLTAHDVGLKQLLDAANLLDHRPEVRLVTISIELPQELRLELSDVMDAAVAEAARRVERLLDGAPDPGTSR